MEKRGAELRPLGQDDARRIYDMMRSYRRYDTSSAAELPFEDWLLTFSSQQYYEWVENDSLTFLSLGNIDWINRSATFGIFADRPGEGHGFRAGEALLVHGFNTLGLNRLSCTVRGDNHRCLAAIAKYPALRHEGTMRGALYREGRFVDVEIFAILADEWRRV